MTIYQFTCSITLDDGFNVEVNGLVTPVVEANTPTQAINHPDVVQFCKDHKCTVYRIVGK